MALVSNDQRVQLLVRLHTQQLVLLPLSELKQFFDLLLLLHLRLLLLLLQLLLLQLLALQLFNNIFLLLQPVSVLLVHMANLFTAAQLLRLVLVELVAFAFDRDHEYRGLTVGCQ